MTARIAAAIGLASLLLLFAADARAAAAAPRAVWIWEADAFRILDDPAYRRGVIRFLKARGISTAYLYADTFRDRTPIQTEAETYRRAIAAFHARGIRVEALLGSIYLHTERYVLPEEREAAAAMLRRVLMYNDGSAPDERFDGAHLDVEPHVLDDWGTRRSTLARRYLDLCRNFVEMRDALDPGLVLGPAIPFWFDGVTVEWNGVTAPLSEHVQRLFDYVALMDYRDRAEGSDGIIAHAADEIAFADSIGRQVVVGVETMPGELDKLTFHDEGSRSMERELALAEAAFSSRPSFSGFAVHHLSTYRALPPRR